jgi:predicted DNA-binding protein
MSSMFDQCPLSGIGDSEKAAAFRLPLRTNSDLEERVKFLSEQMMDTQDLTARNRIEAEIRAANLALTHYKAAMQVEESIGLSA